MHMLRTAVAAYQISSAATFNKLVYYFKKLPLIGKLVPETAYGWGGLKNTVAVLGGLLKLLWLFMAKTLYVVVMLYLPAILSGVPAELQYPLYLQILAFLSFLFGSFNGSVLLQNSMDKYVCLRLMRMPARDYMAGRFFSKHAGDCIGFLPVMAVVAFLFGRSPVEGVLTTLMLACFHMGGEALSLFLFHHTKKVWVMKFWVIAPLALLSLGLAYLPLLTKQVWHTERVVFSLPFLLSALLAGGLGIWYVSIYQNFKMVVSYTVRTETLAEAANAVSAARFSDVQLKERDLEQTDDRKFRHLHGYRYLNAIFFERHKRMLMRPVLVSLGIIAALFVLAAGAVLFFPQAGKEMAARLPGLLPVCVFVMYVVTSNSERICRAMFSNCDIAMLRYSYYREPKVLLANFQIRLFWMMKPNLLLGAAVAAAIVGCALIAGIPWAPVDILLFALSLLLLGVFFSVHYLFLYYVFQPYTTDLGMKNPYFNVIRWAVYMLCFFCTKLDSAPAGFTLLVLGATAVYSVAAILLVFRFAPKNFRVH